MFFFQYFQKLFSVKMLNSLCTELWLFIWCGVCTQTSIVSTTLSDNGGSIRSFPCMWRMRFLTQIPVCHQMQDQRDWIAYYKYCGAAMVQYHMAICQLEVLWNTKKPTHDTKKQLWDENHSFTEKIQIFGTFWARCYWSNPIQRSMLS